MHELVKSVSIENLVNQRAAVLERLRQALDLIGEAEKLAGAAHIGFPRFVIDNHYAVRGRNVTVSGQYGNRTDVDVAIVKTVDATAWQYLMHESGLRTFMDAGAREKWDKQIAEGEIPELTTANVHATFGMLYDARGDMFERGVIECFKRLSWSYKTNLPQKFGKRIVMTYVLHYGGCTNHGKTDYLDDLMRVFHVLEGKPEADHRRGIYHLVSETVREQRAYPKQCENDYVSMRLFKNGNAHVTFKRHDLVEKLNRIITKHYVSALAAPK